MKDQKGEAQPSIQEERISARGVSIIPISLSARISCLSMCSASFVSFSSCSSSSNSNFFNISSTSASEFGLAVPLCLFPPLELKVELPPSDLSSPFGLGLGVGINSD